MSRLQSALSGTACIHLLSLSSNGSLQKSDDNSKYTVQSAQLVAIHHNSPYQTKHITYYEQGNTTPTPTTPQTRLQSCGPHSRTCVLSKKQPFVVSSCSDLSVWLTETGTLFSEDDYRGWQIYIASANGQHKLHFGGSYWTDIHTQGSRPKEKHSTFLKYIGWVGGGGGGWCVCACMHAWVCKRVGS